MFANGAIGPHYDSAPRQSFRNKFWAVFFLESKHIKAKIEAILGVFVRGTQENFGSYQANYRGVLLRSHAFQDVSGRFQGGQGILMHFGRF